VSRLKTKIVAHRGASYLAPENTMHAFTLAEEIGAYGIETDVQLTKDNVPVLIHDVTVNRTTNKKGFVKNYTFSDIQTLDAGKWFSETYKEARIISLESFLQWIRPTHLYLHLELKNNRFSYKNLEFVVFDLLKRENMLERTALSTFNAKSIKRMTRIKDDIERALLLSKQRKRLIQFAKKYDLKALHVEYPMLNDEFVRLCEKENILLRVYTVNDRDDMQRCFALGVDTIFTDRPDVCIAEQNKFITEHDKEQS